MPFPLKRETSSGSLGRGNHISSLPSISETESSATSSEMSISDALPPSSMLTLATVLDDEMLLQCFGHFLDRIMCRENLDFLLAVYGYERLCEMTNTGSRTCKAATQIFYQFLHEDCARPVNLSAEAMNKIRRRLQRRKVYQPLMFRSLRKEVQHLLETDSIPKFCKSSEYRIYADERMNELRAEAQRLQEQEQRQQQQEQLQRQKSKPKLPRTSATAVAEEAGSPPPQKPKKRGLLARWRQRRSKSSSSVTSETADEFEHEDGDSTIGSNPDMSHLDLDFDETLSVASEGSSAAGSEVGRLSAARIVEFSAGIGGDTDPELKRMIDIFSKGSSSRNRSRKELTDNDIRRARSITS